ncbi:hypothetical protein AAMO2058_000623300 [Amorphochlora amoebiformis]
MRAERGKSKWGAGSGERELRKDGHPHSLCRGPDTWHAPRGQVPPERASHLLSLNAVHRREVGTLSNAYNKTKIQLEKLESKSHEMSMELKTLRTQNANQSKRLSSNANLQAKLRCSLAEAKKKLREKTKMLSRFEARVAHGGGQGFYLATRVDELRKMVKKLKSENHDYRERYEESLTRVEAQSSEMEILKKSLNKIAQSIDPKNSVSLATLMHTRARLEAENLQLSRREAKLIVELKNISEIVESTRNSLQEEVKGRKMIDAELESKQERVAELEKEKQALVEYTDNAMSRLDSSNHKVAALELKITKLRKDSLTKETDLERARLRLKDDMAERERTQAQISALQKEREQLEGRLERASERWGKKEGELRAARERIEQLEAENLEMKRVLEGENLEMKRELAEERAKVEAGGEREVRVQEEMRGLRERLDGAIESFDELMEQKNRIEKELRDAQAMISGQQVIREKLEEANRRQAKRIGDLLTNQHSNILTLKQSQFSHFSNNFSRTSSPKQNTLPPKSPNPNPTPTPNHSPTPYPYSPPPQRTSNHTISRGPIPSFVLAPQGMFFPLRASSPRRENAKRGAREDGVRRGVISSSLRHEGDRNRSRNGLSFPQANVNTKARKNIYEAKDSTRTRGTAASSTRSANPLVAPEGGEGGRLPEGRGWKARELEDSVQPPKPVPRVRMSADEIAKSQPKGIGSGRFYQSSEKKKVKTIEKSENPKRVSATPSLLELAAMEI